jgi:hypothetical protein
MGILAIVGVLFGIILGHFFKCFVLIPASGLAALLVLTNPGQMEGSLLGSIAQIVALITSLQIGYVVGLVMGEFRLSHERPKATRGRGSDEKPSSLAQKSEIDRRVA